MQIEMAPFTAWLPVRPDQDIDLVVKFVGTDVPGLLAEFPAFAQVLAALGSDVVAETRKLSGVSGEWALRVRIASRPIHSTGHGCDVLVHLGEDIPDFRRFGLQPGSVLLWEPPDQHRLQPIMPEAVIVYPVPLKEISAQYGEGVLGKGLASFGVLAQLLGIPEESLQVYSRSLPAPCSFDAGFRFARRTLVKRDIYSLPLASAGKRRIILSLEQAVRLGFAAGHCDCGTECSGKLKRSPTEWVETHVAVADRVVSRLHSENHPDVQAYRGLEGNVIALFRGDDAALSSYINGRPNLRIFVAADVPDVMNLLITGHRLIRHGLAGVVGVLVDDTLAGRTQTVLVEQLAAVAQAAEADSKAGPDRDQTGGPSIVQVEREGESGAEVGYVAWGAAQGVVRDAVALCRSFGLRVAAMYPKEILPLPIEALESFAGTVKRVVVVESGPRAPYADRVSRWCSFRPSVVMPEQGKALTPMDIFLREGLGAL